MAAAHAAGHDTVTAEATPAANLAAAALTATASRLRAPLRRTGRATICGSSAASPHLANSSRRAALLGRHLLDLPLEGEIKHHGKRQRRWNQSAMKSFAMRNRDGRPASPSRRKLQ